MQKGAVKLVVGMISVVAVFGLGAMPARAFLDLSGLFLIAAIPFLIVFLTATALACIFFAFFFRAIVRPPTNCRTAGEWEALLSMICGIVPFVGIIVMIMLAGDGLDMSSVMQLTGGALTAFMLLAFPAMGSIVISFIMACKAKRKGYLGGMLMCGLITSVLSLMWLSGQAIITLFVLLIGFSTA